MVAASFTIEELSKFIPLFILKHAIIIIVAMYFLTGAYLVYLIYLNRLEKKEKIKLNLENQKLKLEERRREQLAYLSKMAKLRLQIEKKLQEEQQRQFALLSQMATAVAHNINNPLNNINATVTNIQDDLNMNAISNETLNNDLKRIKVNIQRVAKIVSTFRSYARGNKEQQEIIVFNEIIDNILMMFQGQFESHQIQLIKTLITNETKIFANTFELQEILMILLTNAREAVEGKKNAAIWVSTDQDNEKVYLQIEDNGTGISPERQKELFLPLNTSKANGFGMGLYLVKNILDKSKGYIIYQTSIHGGACFRVSLPIYKG